MKKEQFDQEFDRIFGHAIQLSFQAIEPPTAAQMRQSWLHMLRNRDKSLTTKVLLAASGSEQRVEDSL